MLEVIWVCYFVGMKGTLLFKTSITCGAVVIHLGLVPARIAGNGFTGSEREGVKVIWMRSRAYDLAQRLYFFFFFF